MIARLLIPVIVLTVLPYLWIDRKKIGRASCRERV